MDWNSRQKICSPRRCGQFGTLGSTQRPFVQELEVFSQKVFFLKISSGGSILNPSPQQLSTLLSLLSGQHLEHLKCSTKERPVSSLKINTGCTSNPTLIEQVFLWHSLFDCYIIYDCLWYPPLLDPPLLWTTTSEQVQAILFDIDTAFVPADELNRVRAVLSYAQGKTGLAPSPQGILKYLIQLLY